MHFVDGWTVLWLSDERLGILPGSTEILGISSDFVWDGCWRSHWSSCRISYGHDASGYRRVVSATLNNRC